ncbi:MAG TPA: MASE1 domain-containing protein [Solirubrobacteraceae bacterium]|nr:MASE1 domain-containing protein [Solirubrobacteraceae bacterium]
MAFPDTASFAPAAARRATPGVLLHASNRRALLNYLERVAALVLAYYAAAHLGYAFQFAGPVAAVVWLPVGVAIAFLYLGGMNLWPGVVAGDLLVNNYAALPPGTAIGQSVGNVLEVVLATMLLRRLCPRSSPIATPRGVAGLAVAVGCGTIISAAIGSMASWLGGVIPAHSLLHVWRTWWLGDFTGALILVPLALSWASLPPRPWKRLQVVEGGIMIATVVALSTLQLTSVTMMRTLLFPALIWAALRFGPRGTTLAITIISGSAIWGTVNNLGPFGIGSISDRLLVTQVFIATVSFSGLAIAALVAERERFADSLRASRARLVAASDEVQRRLERDLHDGAQQGLLGLRLKLAQAADVIADDPVEGRRLVLTVERQTVEVIETVRSIASGVYPPLLHERGLAEALKAAARRAPSPVKVRDTRICRHPETTEFAVYFCCLEALQNVAKHAGPDAETSILVWQEGTTLHFMVRDSGMGFDPRTASRGSGLENMRDRIEALGGRLAVRSGPGSGTTVHGAVPLTDRESRTPAA